jgi:hypothetical protein
MENAAEKAAVSLGQADFTCPSCNQSLRFDPRTNRVAEKMVALHFATNNTNPKEVGRGKGSRS